MQPFVSIVITSYDGDVDNLPVIVHSLVHQYEYILGTHSITGAPIRWAKDARCKTPREVIFSHDGRFQGLRNDHINAMLNEDYFSSPLVIQNPQQGGVGHHTRGPGIERATGEWVVCTNADNYFMQGWLCSLRRAITEHPNAGLVYWDCINNLWTWTNYGGSKLTRGHIDLSCAAIRTDIAKEVGFPYRNYDGDFDYIRDCSRLAFKKRLKAVYLKETLSVHN